jgi:hypothetical protein
MFELWLKTPEGIEADEIELDDIKLMVVEIKTKAKAAKADDDPYTNKMLPQPVELILDAISEMLPPKKKCKRCRMNRPPIARRILPAMPRPREHRSAPRRGGGGTGREESGDDGGGGELPPRQKSEYGPPAEITPPQTPRTCAPRVLDGRAQQ